MPMSRCEDVIERISSIMDGDAGALARLRFHAHLAMCDDCRRYRQMVTVREAAGQVRPADLVPRAAERPPDGIGHRLECRLQRTRW